jgi:hypothetical protein
MAMRYEKISGYYRCFTNTFCFKDRSRKQTVPRIDSFPEVVTALKILREKINGALVFNRY